MIIIPAFNKLLLWIPKLGNCKSGGLAHREAAERFYRDLAAQGMKVRVGMEASGHAPVLNNYFRITRPHPESALTNGLLAASVWLFVASPPRGRRTYQRQGFRGKRELFSSVLRTLA